MEESCNRIKFYSFGITPDAATESVATHSSICVAKPMFSMFG